MAGEEIERAAARMQGCCFTDREIALGGCRSSLMAVTRDRRTDGHPMSVSHGWIRAVATVLLVNRIQHQQLPWKQDAADDGKKKRNTRLNVWAVCVRVFANTRSQFSLFTSGKKVINLEKFHVFCINLLHTSSTPT